jgi:hypothetical protein
VNTEPEIVQVAEALADVTKYAVTANREILDVLELMTRRIAELTIRVSQLEEPRTAKGSLD